MLLSCTLLKLAGLAGLASFVIASDDESPRDLGTVLAGNKNLTKYYSLIKKYPDILLQLPNYNGVTIIAPSDKAFDNIPYTALNKIWDPENKDVTIPLLQYHILQGTVDTGSIESGPTYVKPTLLTNKNYTNVTSGQNILINKQPEGTVVLTTSVGTRCTVLDNDIRFQGGLIQVVDNLLVPPAALDATLDAYKVPAFLGGLYAAKIMPDLADFKNITIFAPQNAAFQAVGASLESMNAEQLALMMSYHIIPNQVLVSSSLENGTTLDTLANYHNSSSTTETVTVRKAGNNMYINSAQIVQPDILIANGIMHLISGVLNPEAPAVQPNPEIGTQAPVFPESRASNLPFTSALPCTTDCPVTTTPEPTTQTATPTATTASARFSSSKGAAAPMPSKNVARMAFAVAGVGAGMALL